MNHLKSRDNIAKQKQIVFITAVNSGDFGLLSGTKQNQQKKNQIDYKLQIVP